ncbi:hypothetical protein GUITHDRAFT_119085 [Guillardia theta CCMP2712]|uniref:EF-hand domain-containing protein n=1 Tax=Guillardia theta (strain CCMP2712) TaxID=905079 RepID=L1IFW0_GUITC|nr:hypothetical protein GUITHDRAFT_119085 [Guillardia theta CCMP2712]EKX34774.1 hypothetical protein GUITHDRAFT_119085 [Guillardia theta CCMP2712]|eukprot:XP_005821754.1 hypothetical protein GUITHDRAFT_119085 [Guillardia theta CCMP2712]
MGVQTSKSESAGWVLMGRCGGTAAIELLDARAAEGTLEGFKFDADICRQAFNYYDKDRSGFLDLQELMKLAEVLWDTFYPNGPKIDEPTKMYMVKEIMAGTDNNKDSRISFQEFLPWYKRMAEKHWRATHRKEPSPAPKVKLGAAQTPKLPDPPAKTGAAVQFKCVLTNETYYGIPCKCSSLS